MRRPDPKSFLDSSKLDFFVEEGRIFPSVKIPELPYSLPIFSMHIHSKNSRLFDAKKSKKLIEKAVETSSYESQRIFSIKIFTQSLFLAILRRIRRYV